MQEYLSKTERIQNHIKEILADEQKHSTKEIIEYVDSKLKQNGKFVFQINSYVNSALRLLMANGDYAKVAYGVYQKGGIPYTPNVHERERDLEKTDFRSTMISVKAYAGRIEALFAKKAPFAEMEVKEEAAYWAIKKHSLDVAKSIREKVNKVLRLLDTRQINSRSQAIRKYFEEYMSDKKPHKMNDIKEYIFSCMVKSKEYNGERSTSYIYSAIKNLIEDEGEYQKISRGVYQIRMEHNGVSDGSTYSMDDVGKLLNSGCELSEKNITNLIQVEFTKAGISDALIHSKKVNDMGESDISYARLPAMRGTSTEKWATFSDINGLDAVSSIKISEEEPAKSSFENEFSYYDLSRSVKNMPVDNSEDHAFGGYVDALGESVVEDGEAGLTVDQTSDGIALNMWSGAMHGRGASTIWIYERNKSDYAKSEAFYGQQVTLYPDILYKTGKASLDLQRLAYEVKALQDQPAEVGIVYAQSGRMMNKSVMNTVHNLYSSLLYNGQRVHFVTESTADTMHNLRLLFIPNLINVKPAVMDELKKFVDNGGKLVIFGKDSLTYDENNVPYPDDKRNYIISRAQVIDIVVDGIVVTYPDKVETTKLITEILKNEKLNHVQLVDANTGEPIYNTDYFATTLDGKLLVQISYYAKIAEGTKNIKVLVNGEPVAEMKDLISGKTYNESFTMEPISAVLLEIDTDNKFVDTYGHWAERDIVDMTEKEVVHGISETMFAPEKRITRAEFTALLVRMLGLENANENTFSDIRSNDWFCSEVNAAAKAGITAKTDGIFDGNGHIPREEMAYMLKKAYELKRGATAEKGKRFTDSNMISAVYKDAVNFVSGAGLISGYEDGSFRPKGMLTRAEAVKVLSKLLEAMI